MNLDAVGQRTEPFTVSWSSTDALLYALGVGAGQDDPLDELAFTTENSAGVDQQVLPTFGAILTSFRAPLDGVRPRIDFGTFNPAYVVHAEEAVALSRPLPTCGEIDVSTELVGIYDKGSGALVETVARGHLDGDADDEPTVLTRMSIFIRGEGGFGVRGPSDPWSVPAREPDRVISASTRPDQALLYRLSGDRNPLHSDPAFAQRAGFAKPILHGMCTYGVVGRVLLRELAGGDPSRFASISGRFSRPVHPGDRLEIAVWESDDQVLFRVTGPRGDIVLDRGTLQLRHGLTPQRGRG